MSRRARPSSRSSAKTFVKLQPTEDLNRAIKALMRIRLEAFTIAANLRRMFGYTNDPQSRIKYIVNKYQHNPRVQAQAQGMVVDRENALSQGGYIPDQLGKLYSQLDALFRQIKAINFDIDHIAMSAIELIAAEILYHAFVRIKNHFDALRTYKQYKPIIATLKKITSALDRLREKSIEVGTKGEIHHTHIDKKIQCLPYRQFEKLYNVLSKTNQLVGASELTQTFYVNEMLKAIRRDREGLTSVIVRTYMQRREAQYDSVANTIAPVILLSTYLSDHPELIETTEQVELAFELDAYAQGLTQRLISCDPGQMRDLLQRAKAIFPEIPSKCFNIDLRLVETANRLSKERYAVKGARQLHQLSDQAYQEELRLQQTVDRHVEELLTAFSAVIGEPLDKIISGSHASTPVPRVDDLDRSESSSDVGDEDKGVEGDGQESHVTVYQQPIFNLLSQKFPSEPCQSKLREFYDYDLLGKQERQSQAIPEIGDALDYPDDFIVCCKILHQLYQAIKVYDLKSPEKMQQVLDLCQAACSLVVGIFDSSLNTVFTETVQFFSATAEEGFNKKKQLAEKIVRYRKEFFEKNRDKLPVYDPSRRSERAILYALKARKARDYLRAAERACQATSSTFSVTCVRTGFTGGRVTKNKMFNVGFGGELNTHTIIVRWLHQFVTEIKKGDDFNFVESVYLVGSMANVVHWRRKFQPHDIDVQFDVSACSVEDRGRLREKLLAFLDEFNVAHNALTSVPLKTPPRYHFMDLYTMKIMGVNIDIKFAQTKRPIENVDQFLTFHYSSSKITYSSCVMDMESLCLYLPQRYNQFSLFDDLHYLELAPRVKTYVIYQFAKYLHRLNRTFPQLSDAEKKITHFFLDGFESEGRNNELVSMLYQRGAFAKLYVKYFFKEIFYPYAQRHSLVVADRVNSTIEQLSQRKPLPLVRSPRPRRLTITAAPEQLRQHSTVGTGSAATSDGASDPEGRVVDAATDIVDPVQPLSEVQPVSDGASSGADRSLAADRTRQVTNTKPGDALVSDDHHVPSWSDVNYHRPRVKPVKLVTPARQLTVFQQLMGGATSSPRIHQRANVPQSGTAIESAAEPKPPVAATTESQSTSNVTGTKNTPQAQAEKARCYQQVAGVLTDLGLKFSQTYKINNWSYMVFNCNQAANVLLVLQDVDGGDDLVVDPCFKSLTLNYAEFAVLANPLLKQRYLAKKLNAVLQGMSLYQKGSGAGDSSGAWVWRGDESSRLGQSHQACLGHLRTLILPKLRFPFRFDSGVEVDGYSDDGFKVAVLFKPKNEVTKQESRFFQTNGIRVLHLNIDKDWQRIAKKARHSHLNRICAELVPDWRLQEDALDAEALVPLGDTTLVYLEKNVSLYIGDQPDKVVKHVIWHMKNCLQRESVNSDQMHSIARILIASIPKMKKRKAKVIHSLYNVEFYSLAIDLLLLYSDLEANYGRFMRAQSVYIRWLLVSLKKDIVKFDGETISQDRMNKLLNMVKNRLNIETAIKPRAYLFAALKLYCHLFSFGLAKEINRKYLEQLVRGIESRIDYSDRGNLAALLAGYAVCFQVGVKSIADENNLIGVIEAFNQLMNAGVNLEKLPLSGLLRCMAQFVFYGSEEQVVKCKGLIEQLKSMVEKYFRKYRKFDADKLESALFFESIMRVRVGSDFSIVEEMHKSKLLALRAKFYDADSALERIVLSKIRSCLSDRYEVEKKYYEKNLGVVVDIVITDQRDPKNKILIFVDGPFHLRPHNQYRDKMYRDTLKCLGYRVLVFCNSSYSDYSEIRRDLGVSVLSFLRKNNFELCSGVSSVPQTRYDESQRLTTSRRQQVRKVTKILARPASTDTRTPKSDVRPK